MKKTDILKTLADFIAIESVSTDPNRRSQIAKAVEFLHTQLDEMGFKVNVYKKANAAPLVVGVYQPAFVPSEVEGLRRGKGKTIGIYGHYDVQPEDPAAEWRTPPFKLTVKNGKFYGRGVADNKGHVVQNLTAVKRLMETGKLKNNVVFVFEGEEEGGSSNFEPMCLQAKEILSTADVFYVTDMGMHGKNQPQIFYGLRGICYFQLTITAGRHDLHSGIYGNRVFNPINVLVDLIAKTMDAKTGEILIPHFYDQVRRIGKNELKLLGKVMRKDSEEIAEAGVFGLTKYGGRHSGLASKIRPSFDVHGIVGGYIRDGEKTVIPKTAAAKFSFRLVERQTPAAVGLAVKKFIKDNLPKEISYELKSLSQADPFYTDLDNLHVEKTVEVFREIFKNEVLFNRSGGTVQAAQVLQKLFAKPVILTGFTLPDDRIHAPNENFDEEMFWKGIIALEKIYSQ